MRTLKEIIAVHSFRRNMLTYAALLIGVTLLFISLQLYIDTYSLMNSRQFKNDRFDYLVLNKNITNEMMGKNEAAFFSTNEIEQLGKQKAVKQLGLIESNQFPVEASNFGELAFSTQLFFESIPVDFLDVETEKFSWKPGEEHIPVILSQDFLNLYNFGFALSQGLPQMSEETVKAISFNIRIGNSEDYTAEVVGFSQRYSSVIVPLSFMQYANAKFGAVHTRQYSRLVLQTTEADDPHLVKYIRDNNYSTQNEKIKWSKVRTIMGAVFGSSGLIGVFILVLCMMLLAVYLDLIITRAGQKLQLLSMLGYRTRILQKHFTSGIFWSFTVVVAISIVVTGLCKWALASWLTSFHVVMSKSIAWQVILLAALILLFIFAMFNYRSKKIIQQYLA